MRNLCLTVQPAMQTHQHKSGAFILSLCAGAFAVLGYAPFYFYPAPILALAALFLLQHSAPTVKRAAIIGWAFGMGLFGAGVSWIYVSLHDFGEMPMLPAGLATAGFCAFLALFPAVVGWLARKLPAEHRLPGLPFLWVLLEWVRLWIFTGFPWLAVGYAQIPYSPLAGLAPVFGVFGASLASAVCAALIAAALRNIITRKILVVCLLGFWISGALLKHVTWSDTAGQPMSFSLLQGNIAQDLKWREETLAPTLDLYYRMTKASSAQLIVLPETALPLLASHLPVEYLPALARHARDNRGNVLIGLAEREVIDGNVHYFNSAISMGSAPEQHYRKSHLVPFGEFIPFKSVLGWIYNDLLHIPLTDLSSGATHQQPLLLSGQKVAVNICYEDTFGEEIIRQLPEATLLVNLSNDAWYGDSLAAHQHLQMSQARALETSRMMLRATNTGATAVIDRDGRVLSQAPLFKQLSLDGLAQGYTGSTPYVRWGNWPVIILILLVITRLYGLSWVRKKK